VRGKMPNGRRKMAEIHFTGKGVNLTPVVVEKVGFSEKVENQVIENVWAR
jgi:hypothetical protein